MASMDAPMRDRQVQYVDIDMNPGQPPSEKFKERLRAARYMRDWSQGNLAARAALPPSSIAHLEAGSRKPSFETLRRLAIALDVTTDYLLGRTDDPALAESADPLYRNVSRLTGRDRELATDFLEMLAGRNAARKKRKKR